MMDYGQLSPVGVGDWVICDANHGLEIHFGVAAGDARYVHCLKKHY